jgi:deoxyribodipyrimidine photo-lyase
MVCRPDAVPTSVAGFDAGRALDDLWTAGERAAKLRLNAFVTKQIRAYKDRRDLPAEAATSRLSPYLTAGVISPRQCLLAAAEANGGRLDGGRAGPSCWVSELIWREFYRHVLVGFPRVSMNRAFKEKTERVPWRYDGDQFADWCAGRTGVPIVDAGMRELAQTGWMHNRLRMIVAMFLTKDLLIDWRWGERHFMRQLIDGDLASNNGGWQWSASTGTDAAPYFRIFNPYRQGQRYDPAGNYIRQFVPELADVPSDWLHDPNKFPAEERQRLGYPEPMIDHAAARQQALAAFNALARQ